MRPAFKSQIGMCGRADLTWHIYSCFHTEFKRRITSDFHIEPCAASYLYGLEGFFLIFEKPILKVIYEGRLSSPRLSDDQNFLAFKPGLD